MPGRGHSTAPKFDQKYPCELRRYFNELDLLFDTCGITSETDKKIQTLCYVDMDTVDLWKNISEYNNNISYKDFIKAIYKLYPGSKDERK